jgi:response regulator RpfG family c-di-GMP phosphodiesterase
MVTDYAEGVTVEAIAAELGKTVRSIVAKLSREKVYKAKEYKTKTGEKVQKKDALVDKMAEVFGLTEAEADSLTKANKTALTKILNTFETVCLEA